MPPTKARSSRVFTISFPEPLALQVEQVAREESRTISELFREAWRAYKVQSIERQIEALRPNNPPHLPALGEEDMQQIQDYVDVVRAETYARRRRSVDRRP